MVRRCPTQCARFSSVLVAFSPTGLPRRRRSKSKAPSVHLPVTGETWIQFFLSVRLSTWTNAPYRTFWI